MGNFLKSSPFLSDFLLPVIVQQEPAEPSRAGSVRLPRREPRIDRRIPFGYDEFRRHVVAEHAARVCVGFVPFPASHPCLDPQDFRNARVIDVAVETVRAAGVVGHASRETVFVIEEADVAVEIFHLFEQFRVRIHESELDEIRTAVRVEAVAVAFLKRHAEDVRHVVRPLSRVFRFEFLHHPVPVIKVGVQDQYGRSGKVPELLEIYGLTAKNIYEKAKLAISKK